MPNTEEYKDKIAIITGASSGIGQGIALQYGKAGMKVIVNYHSDKEDALITKEQIIKEGGQAEVFQADVSQEEEVKAMFGHCRKVYGEPDLLVNNAGIQKDSPLVDMSLDDWTAVISTNLTGHFLCTREAVKSFLQEKKARNKRKSIGNIIFISSVHEKIPWGGHSNYAASKGGLGQFMRSVAQELAPERIRVNSINPGAIKTDINRDEWENEKGKKAMKEKIPYMRIGVPEDIAKAALWLASDDSDYVTGATLYVDGGMTLYPAFME